MRDLLNCNFTKCELCGRVRITYNGACGPCSNAILDDEEKTDG